MAERPLSPHLQIYKPQFTSGMSIFHKITGISLAGVIIVFILWMASLSFGKDVYDQFMELANSIIGRIFLIGWTWAYFYHIACSARHLTWATGRGTSLNFIYKSAYVALAFSFLATASLWAFILGVVK